MGSMVTFPSNGHTCEGYLSTPPDGSGPAVVVIQEWWGLVPHIRTVCDRFAQQGFVALAPDLYHGAVTKEPDDAQKRMMALEFPRVGQDLQGAAKWLLSSDLVTSDQVGVVGFCMGGGLALYLASLDSEEVGAVVPYYGVTPWKEAQVSPSSIHMPVMGHWAEQDHSTPRDTIAVLERELKASAEEVEFFWYEGCDHAFFNDDRPEVFNKDAAALSWDRTVGFLHRILG